MTEEAKQEMLSSIKVLISALDKQVGCPNDGDYGACQVREDCNPLACIASHFGIPQWIQDELDIK